MVILQITFDYSGGYGEKMYEECKDLAQSITMEKGFLWKIWTENSKKNIAGGIYAFDNEQNAQNYANMHIKRLENFKVAKNFKYEILNTNEKLSKITHFEIQ
ncbi:MAG: monooxygenase [Campylobacter sputorum]|uniref:monooxygenase n=1 Tax=Campylobacter sputorum TaxID=206 RepID=UPI000B78F12B|nr:monooxygenase [Campylobacter sputorum]ASM36456.1 putative monooxygenase YdhR [Campylobacter sputorum bv. faecalis CCUG 20703]ASM38151.1 putative monooxygenase YdhR [Campylobacter sputorum bv. paraureolyticus LMG 11764]MDY6121299.1 monooxygenase [Campylobacter sputorum]